MKKKTLGKVLIISSFLILLFGFWYNFYITNTPLNFNDLELVPGSVDKITISKNDEHNNIISSDENSIINSRETNDDINIINNKLRNILEEKYSIKIKYGQETRGYSVAGLSTSEMTDPKKINNNLNKLEYMLSLYPSGFMNEISNSIPLTIYLVEDYSSYGISGITDSNYNRANMSLSDSDEFVESFHHENYHYLERYIFKKGGNFVDWVNYNPVGFTYGKDTNKYLVYSKTLSSDVYFVNEYSKTDEYEDRASVFEYMMADNKSSCLNEGYPVYDKAVAISLVIDRVFNSCSINKTEYWERFIQ